MIIEDKVMAIFVEANPAPDIDDLDLVEVGSTEYLATLQQGSSEMTQLSTKQEETKQRSRSMAWLAAAALVILVGVAVFVLNQGTDEAPVATNPVPTTLAEPAPTTTPESAPTTQPAPTTTIDPAEAEWEAIPLSQSVLTAGSQYRTGNAGFSVPLAYTVPQYDDTSDKVLTKVADFAEFVVIDCADASGHCGAIWIFDPRVPTVDEAVNSVMSTSGLSFSEQTPTDIGGASGARFEISLDEPGSATLHGMSNGLDQIGILQGDRVLAWFLDVAGQPVGIFAVAHETGPFLDEAQTLIESIIWKDLR